MTEDFHAIAERVNQTVLANTASTGSWGLGHVDLQAPIYNADPEGDRNEIGLFGDDIFTSASVIHSLPFHHDFRNIFGI